MWSSPRKEITTVSILKSHLSELESAVLDAEMFNVAERGSVYEALYYIEKERPHTRNKCSIFKEILENHTEFQPIQLKMAYLELMNVL